MPASQNYGLGKGRNAAAAITKKRFVKAVAGTPETVTPVTTLGEMAAGVSLFSVSAAEILKGKGVSVLVEGRAIVEASAAINEGQPVSTAADGRAKVAATGEFILGYCDEAASGATAECSVVLSLSGAKA
jgi:hypothetical protein